MTIKHFKKQSNVFQPSAMGEMKNRTKSAKQEPKNSATNKTKAVRLHVHALLLSLQEFGLFILIKLMS